MQVQEVSPSQQPPAVPTKAPARLPTEEDRVEASKLPLDTRFALGAELTPVQRAFLDEHGFIIFGNVATEEEVNTITEEVKRIEQCWLSQKLKRINGIPLFIGKGEEGQPFINRLPFTSLHSDYISKFIHDPRFEPVRQLVDADARVGDKEKDGLVFNRFMNVPGTAYKRLGWHTDGLRDVFLGRMPKQMLNVGVHFSRVRKEDGGLRLIPGSHNQSFWQMCTYKPHFIAHKPDPNEIAVETEPGDLTVHDGRLWHRVERSPYVGKRSLRQVMYIPYVTDDFAPKSAKSKMPFYHILGKAGRAIHKLFERS